MLAPKKTTYQKMHRLDSNIKQKRNCKLSKGSFGLKSISCSRISSRQLDSVQKAMQKKTNRLGKVLLCIFPNVSITEKPSEIRMGKGKGNVAYWCYPIKIGQIIFEFQGISQYICKQLSKLCTSKLSVRTKFILIKQKF
jgi:large subunit ribosomal protein L16